MPSSRGVIVQLAEEVPPIANGGAWRPRPHHFTLPRLGRVRLLAETVGASFASVSTRHFYIFIWIGRRASSAQVGLFLHALDGMIITTV